MNFIKNTSFTQKYLIFLPLVCLSSLLFCYFFSNKFGQIIDNESNMVFKNINFGNGPLIHNLMENGIYSSKFLNGVDFVLQKLPILPLLIFLISKISTNFYIIIIIKNLITFSFIFWMIVLYLKSYNLNSNYLFLFLAIFLIPYNLFTSLNFEYADNLVAILLPSLFLSLVSKMKQKYTISSFIIFILYLTKTSMFFVSLGIPLIILIFEKKKYFIHRKKLIFLGPILAILIWSSFSYLKTERIAIGTNSLTINSLGLTLALDKRFFDYYPDKSMDILFAKIEIPKKLNNEWKIFDFYKKKNKAHLSNKENLKNYLMTFPKKILIILYHVRRDSAYPDENGNFNNRIRYSLILNKFFINVSIILSLYKIITSIKNKKTFKDDFIFFSMISLSLLPLIAGWATGKHLVPISILSYFYLVHKNLIYKSTKKTNF